MTFLDKAGREVKAGDLIIYGHALGRCAGLKYGKVLEVKETPQWRATNQPRLKLKVQGIDQDFNRAPTLSRPGYLEFPERVLKLTRSQVPENVLKLLE